MKTMNPSSALRLLATAILGGLLLMGCRWDPVDCDGSEREACEQLTLLALLSRQHLHTPIQGTQPLCAAQASGAATMGYVQVGTVQARSSCYYRFEVSYEPGQPGPFTPSFRLVPEVGNTDLYVAHRNDVFGGTIGYEKCDATSAGGGWIRCSRKGGNSEEEVTTAASGIEALEVGDFRLVSVYNPTSGAVSYALFASRFATAATPGETTQEGH